MREPLLVLDADLRVVSANRAFFRLFRVTEGEIDGCFLYDLGGGTWDIPRLRDLLGEVLQQDAEVEDFEVAHRFPEIGHRSLLLNTRRIQWPGEEAETILLAIEDVTERKKVEGMLMLRTAALEAAAVGVLLTDTEGVIRWANPAMVDLAGYRPEELVGQHTRVFRSGVHEAALYEEMWDSITSGRVWRGELVNRRKDGSLYPEEMTITPVKGDGGRVSHFIAIKQDITERKQTEERLRESETWRRLALEGGKLGAWSRNLQTGEMTFDEQCQRLFKVLPGESSEESFERIHPEDREAVEQALAAALDPASTGQYIVDHRLLLPDGGVRWLSVRGTCHFEERGGERRPGRLVGVVLDVTEHKRAEAEVRKLNEELELHVRERTAQLEAANKELEAFSYSVSHDLRAPLRSIDGFSRILLESYAGDLNDKALHYLQRIRQNTMQMGELVDDLLRFSRLSRQPLGTRTIDMDRLVRGVLAELLPERAERAVDVEIRDLPPCEADPRLLKQVYVNLFGNALKFTRHREVARIRAGARQEADGLVYYVADNGAGFDMRYADRLFDVFQRLHPAEDYEGTGVGLAIVQRIVHRHGGEVWAEAKPDRGATFYFTLKHPLFDGDQTG